MQRIQHIVSDLKTFAYRKPGAEVEGTPFLFEKALDSSQRLTAHELRGVKMTREMPDDTLVLGDEAAIIGVLINLFSNAALAMRKAGTQSPAIHTTVRWEDKRLRVTVRDNGPASRRRSRPRVRTVLHHAGSGPGPGSWPVDQLRRNRTSWRRAVCRERWASGPPSASTCHARSKALLT
jgi:nitrogen-specific signal transduction histidine kinase